MTRWVHICTIICVILDNLYSNGFLVCFAELKAYLHLMMVHIHNATVYRLSKRRTCSTQNRSCTVHAVLSQIKWTSLPSMATDPIRFWDLLWWSGIGRSDWVCRCPKSSTDYIFIQSMLISLLFINSRDAIALIGPLYFRCKICTETVVMGLHLF